MKTMPECKKKINLKSALIAAIALISIGCQIPSANALSNPLISFESDRCLRPGCEETTVQKIDLTKVVTVAGNLKLSSRTSLTFGSSGRIESIAVRSGDLVTEGQMIATLDSPEAEVAYFMAEQDMLGTVQALDELLEPVNFQELLNARLEIEFNTNEVTQAEEALKLVLDGSTRQQFLSAEADLISAELDFRVAEEMLEATRLGPTPEEVAVLESDILNKSADLNAVEAQLAELVEGSDPLILDLTRNLLALAREDLEAARERLSILENGPASLLVREKNFNLLIAELRLGNAKQAFKDIKRGRTKRELDNEDLVIALRQAEFQIAVAEFNVEFAQEGLAEVLAGPTSRELSQVAANVNHAELALRSADQEFESAKREPTEKEIDLVRNEVIVLLASIESSTNRLHNLMKPDSLIKSQLLNQYKAAAETLKTAKQRYEDVTKFSGVAILREKQGALDTSKGLLEIAIKELERLETGPDERIVEVRRAELELAKNAVAVAKQRTEILSPYSGIVSGLSVGVGDFVNEGLVIAQLIDEGRFEVVAAIDEKNIVDLKVGQSVLAEIKILDNLVVPGVVSSVFSVASQDLNSSASFLVVVTLHAEESGGIREGMSASVEIIIDERKDALSVPIAAITDRNGQESLEIVDGDKVKFVPVSTGLKSGSVVEVTGDINVGDMVLIRRRS